MSTYDSLRNIDTLQESIDNIPALTGSNFLVTADNLFIPNTLSAGGAEIQANVIISPYPPTYPLNQADACTFTGYYSGGSITDGSNNSAYGALSLSSCQTGNSNTAVGRNSLYTVNNSFNTAIGSGSGYLCEGESNLFAGHYAGDSGMGCNYCVSLGKDSDITTSASNQIALGYQATTTVDNSCQIGNSSVNLLKLGSTNVLDTSKVASTQLWGCSSTTLTSAETDNFLMNGTTNNAITSGCSQNSGYGYLCLDALTSGAQNTGFGRSSLSKINTGTQNVGCGRLSLSEGTSASQCTGIGNGALLAVTTSTYSIGIGHLSGGVLSTGTAGIYIGVTNASSSSVSNEIVIAGGSSATTGAGANSVTLGNSSVNLLKLGSYTTISQPNSTSKLIGCNASGTISGANNIICNGTETNEITSQSSNSVFGHLAGDALSTGTGLNCLYGRACGSELNTGSMNSFYGGLCGGVSTTGSSNAGFGHLAFGSGIMTKDTGYNIGIGSSSARYVEGVARSNICIGYACGGLNSGGSWTTTNTLKTGVGNLYIGECIATSSASPTNEVVIAGSTVADGSLTTNINVTGFGNNTITLGNGSCTAIVPSVGVVSLGASTRPFSGIWLENNTAPICGQTTITFTTAGVDESFTVSTSGVLSGDLVFLQLVTYGGAGGSIRDCTVLADNIINTTSFAIHVIKDSGGFTINDTATYNWWIIHPTS